MNSLVSRFYRGCKNWCFFLLSTAFVCGEAGAADSLQVRYWMNRLTAPNMHGRGYVHGGLDSAANYIKAELKQMGLRTSFLPFVMPVNSFPGKMELSINGRVLQPGKDFLVAPESAAFKGKVALTQADSATWINAEKKVMLGAVDKLTWSISTVQEPYTRLLVNKASMPANPVMLDAQVEARWIPQFEAKNLMASITGSRRPDSMIVFTAHYDHLGMMGAATSFDGANDNASGVAMMLALASYYVSHPHDYTIVFLFFAGEEAGLLGSEYFVQHAPFALDKIRFLLNLDLMGNGDEGITVVNATEFPAEFELLQKINREGNFLAAVNSRGKAKNSDHYYFTEKGVPSFFWYTLGKRKAYHDVEDIADTVPFHEAADLQQLILRFAQNLVSLPRK